jgi:uncharacterized protein
MSPADQNYDSRKEARYYLIFLNSVPGKPLAPDAVKLHAAHLAELDDEGKLILAGPIPERAGGLIALRVANIAEAKAVAEEDPMVRGGYQTYELGTWLMSNRQNGYQPTFRLETQP